MNRITTKGEIDLIWFLLKSMFLGLTIGVFALSSCQVENTDSLAETPDWDILHLNHSGEISLNGGVFRRFELNEDLRPGLSQTGRALDLYLIGKPLKKCVLLRIDGRAKVGWYQVLLYFSWLDLVLI